MSPHLENHFDFEFFLFLNSVQVAHDNAQPVAQSRAVFPQGRLPELDNLCGTIWASKLNVSSRVMRGIMIISTNSIFN